MPATFSVKCPECRTTLSSRKPIPGGKLLTCPKCDVMFAAPKPPADDIIDDVEVVEDDVEVVEDVEVVDEGPSRTPHRTAPSRSPAPRKGPAPARRPAVNSGIEVVEDDGVEVVDDDEPPRRPRKQFRSKKGGSKAGVLIASILGGVVLLGGGALTWWLLSGGGDEPLAYVPANSPFVGGADVKTIFASPLAGPASSLLSLPAIPLGRIAGATGAPVRDSFERILVAGSNDGVTMVIKTTSAIDKDKLAAAYGNPTTASLGGQKIYRPAPPGPKAVFVPNKLIAVCSDAPDNQLESVARSSGKKSVLSGDMAALAAKFSANTIWCVVGPEAMSNPAVQAGMMSSLNANPAGKTVAPMLQSARGLGLSINLTPNDVEIRFGIQCADAAAAQKTVSDLQAADAKSKSDPLAKAAMLMAPTWAKKLQTEMESSQQAVADGDLALITVKLTMGTVQEAIEAVSAMLPSAAGGAPSADGAAPTLAPKGRGQRKGG